MLNSLLQLKMSQQYPNQRFSGNQNFGNNNQGYQNQNPGMNYNANPRQSFNTNQNYGNQQFPKNMPYSNQGVDPSQFNMQMPPQGPINPGGQMSQAPSAASTRPQGPIVQHVMIPVPVPVGTNIPPHLLRPQIINTTGPPFNNMNQGQIMTPQGQVNFPGIPNQPFQAQGFCSPPDQNLNQFQSQQPVPEQASFGTRDRKMSDDLNYYLGKDQRDERSRSGSQDNWQRSRSPNNDKVNRSKYEDKTQNYKSGDRMFSSRDSFDENRERRQDNHSDKHNQRFVENKHSDTDRNRTRKYENYDSRSHHSEKSRNSNYSKGSGHHENDYKRHSSDNTDRHRQSSIKEARNYEPDETDKLSRHGIVKSSNNENRRVDDRVSTDNRHNSRMNSSDRNSEFHRTIGRDDFPRSENNDFERRDNVTDFRVERSDRYERHERKSERIINEFNGNDRYHGMSERSRNEVRREFQDDVVDSRNVLLASRNEPESTYFDNRSRHSEHHSDRDNFDSRRDFDERGRDNYDDHRRMDEFDDRRRDDVRDNIDEQRRDKYNRDDRKSRRDDYDLRRDIIDNRRRDDLDIQRRRDDFDNVIDNLDNRRRDNLGDRRSHRDDFDERKRKHSTGSVERYGKLRRDCSPVSDHSKPHDDIKIHVSDRGRWIESYPNDVELDNVEFRSNVECTLTYDDRDNIDGTEMISDIDSVPDHEFADIRHRRDGRGSEIDRRSQRSPTYSRHSRHSDDRLRSRPHSENRYENRNFDAGDKNRNIRHTGEKFVLGKHLKLPNICLFHNQKGCLNHNKCTYLHICKHFILDQCKYGDACTKSHNLFIGQPYVLLKNTNPGFVNSNISMSEVKAMLREKAASLSSQPRNIVINEPPPARTKVVIKKENVEKSPVKVLDESIEVDPSFDARNYMTDNFVESISAEVKKKVDSLKTEGDNEKDKKTEKDNESNNAKNNDGKNENNNRNKDQKGDKSNKKIKNETKSRKEGRKISSYKQSSRKALDTSPVSGEEDDWEKYEKYETVSDDNMSDKNADREELDNVSSDESVITVEEIIHSCAIDEFPIPTPENIAVPIGMNDPLVFNRPLKNNPSSYVGPMNRPPPMFPITNNAPLFPVLQHNPNLAPQSVGFPGSVPNHLPSPELMSQVIQHLPKFTVPPPEPTQTFKNDNNPVNISSASPKKLKSEKVEKDPELKETIKKLWTFPHKSVFTMSVIEFVTETEAYKDELIAEIVRILVTLELPYVTIKKLQTVIKEKIQVNIKSETDLRKILDMYPENFKVIENVGSDDESDSSDTKRVFQIKANIKLGFCDKHGFLPFAIGKCDCRALHICKFYFLNDCTNKHCKFGHKLKTEHNINVLRHHKLHRLTGEELITFMSDVDNRNKDTVPKICKYYVREKGCYKGDSTDFDSICHSLHLCSYVIKGKCLNRECERSHSLFDKQPLSLLQKFGLDPNELGAEKVFQMLSEKAFFSSKDTTSTSSKAYDTKRSTANTSKTKTSKTSNQVVRTPTKTSSTHYVKNYNNPAICKFYNNETGCRKKDWGSAGKCFFLHICQYYVNDDCKFGEKCKRSHDFYSGQAAEILEKFEFDLDNMSSRAIIDRLNNRAPIVQATMDDVSGGDDKVLNKQRGEKNKVDAHRELESKEQLTETVARADVEKNDGFVSDNEKQQAAASAILKANVANSSRSANTNITDFGSCNVEDVIKHIMNQNKIKQEKLDQDKRK